VTKPRASRRHSAILDADQLALIIINNRGRLGLSTVVPIAPLDRLLSRPRRKPLQVR
jgi:hypothetical protein